MSEINLLKKIIHLDTVESTNNYAANLYNAGKIHSETVILADNQTNGRGQRGKKWESNPYENLTFSIILPANKITLKPPIKLVFLTAIAIRNMLSNLKIESTLKWPNDVYINDKKVAGVLIESNFTGNKIKNAIIGIGINVEQKDFDSQNATSISNEVKFKLSKEEILYMLLNEISKFLKNKHTSFETILEQYNERLYKRNEFLTFKSVNTNEKFKGKINRVNINGNLVIDINGREKEFRNGEIKYII